MNFDDQLREALRRPEPPAGFAERVLARLGEAQQVRREGAPSRRRALSAAAAVLILALGGWGSYRLEQNRRAEQAAEDAIVALRIASAKITLAKETMESHSGR